MQKKYLSLFFPTLMADLLSRSLAQSSTTKNSGERKPLLLITPVRGKSLVARCCKKAAAAGVVPEMDAVSARVKVPEAEMFSFAPEAEKKLLREIASWAVKFSSAVAPDTPLDAENLFDFRSVGIQLEIGGSEMLFHGSALLVSIVERELRILGITARMSTAPTVGAAWALSRYGKGNVHIGQNELVRAVERLPVAALRIPSELEECLREIGLETVGHILALPRKSAGDRFGSLLVRRIEELLGEREELVPAFVPPPRKRIERAFEYGIGDRERLKEATLRLLDRLLDSLRPLQQKPASLLLEIKFRCGSLLQKAIPLSLASNDRNHLAGLLCTRIDRLPLPGEVASLALSAPATEPIEGKNGDYLESNAPLRAQLGQLLDSLTKTLGEKALFQLEATPSHIPERGQRRTPAVKVAGGRNASAPRLPLSTGERPSLLLSPPQEIAALALLPDKPPFRIHWRNETHTVLSGRGPERIAPEWWKDGEENSLRDYFKVQLSSGLWIWIYRSAQGVKQSWYLHGIWT